MWFFFHFKAVKSKWRGAELGEQKKARSHSKSCECCSVKIVVIAVDNKNFKLFSYAHLLAKIRFTIGIFSLTMKKTMQILSTMKRLNEFG